MSPWTFSLVNIVLGHYSPVNNVPPHWILSPLEQGWELSSVDISTSIGGNIETSKWFGVGFTSYTGLRDYGAYCVLYAVSLRLLPWLFLLQHFPLTVLTQGKKPELVLLLPWMTNTGREGLATRLSASYLVSCSITWVCSGHVGLYKAYPSEIHFISVCVSRCRCQVHAWSRLPVVVLQTCK